MWLCAHKVNGQTQGLSLFGYAVERCCGVEVGTAVVHQQTDAFFEVRTDSMLPFFLIAFCHYFWWRCLDLESYLLFISLEFIYVIMLWPDCSL